jgi:hypothetical protein
LVRIAAALVLVATIALPAAASATSQPDEIFFPQVKVLGRQDRTARGQLDPSITRRFPAFCWELGVATRTQPLWAYLRRVGSGRVVAKFSMRDAHVPPWPWPGAGTYSGCAGIPRADERAFLRRPRLYYLDIRTRTAAHAAIARPHGPRLHL